MGLMLNGGRDGSITYLAMNLHFCYGDCSLIKKCCGMSISGSTSKDEQEEVCHSLSE
jgi:hypothetical protein